MQNSKKNRIGQATLKRFMTSMAMNLSEEERERLKQSVFGIVMRLDRVSTPEAMEYVEAIFRSVDDLEEVLASKRPVKKPRARKERKVRIQKAESHTPVNGYRDHGHANGHLQSGHSIFHESGFE